MEPVDLDAVVAALMREVATLKRRLLICEITACVAFLLACAALYIRQAP